MIRSGYTKRFLDGQIDHGKQVEDILQSYANLQKVNDYLVVEVCACVNRCFAAFWGFGTKLCSFCMLLFTLFFVGSA